MTVMIVSVIVVTLVFGIGTVVWWAMMNDWIKKDQQRRGPHHGGPHHGNTTRPAPASPRPAAGPRVIRSEPTQRNEPSP